MLLLARFFKFLFRTRFLRKYYFAIYKRGIKPLDLFRGLSTTCPYDDHLQMKVDLDDWIQLQVFFFGLYEPVHIGFLKTQLKSGDVFMDIGANVGCYTLTGSYAVGESGNVIAFEPVNKVADRLEHNIHINSLSNVRVVRKAVYNQETILKLHIAKQENLGMSSIHPHDAESGKITEFPATSLDHFLENKGLNSIKLIKIDVEGAEIFALEGMKKTIEEYKPVMMVEVSAQVLKLAGDREKVFQFFREKGYSRFVLKPSGELIEPSNTQLKEFTNFVFTP